MKQLLLHCLSILFLCSVALINGFPILFFDDAWYLINLFWNFNDGQKALAYSWLMTLTGSRYSLWFMAITQAFFANLVLTLLCNTFGLRERPWIRFMIVAFLSLCSPLPWLTGQIMPDVFTGLMAICLFLLLVRRTALNRLELTAASLLYILSITVHNSHFSISVALLTTISIGFFLFGRKQIKRIYLPALLTTVALFTVLGLNYQRTGAVFLSRTGPASLLNRLIEDGVIQKLLREHCDTTPYSLCPYQDKLTQKRLDFLMLNPEIFNKLGGWEDPQGAFAPMVRDVLLFYPRENAYLALNQLLTQIMVSDVASFIFPFGPETRLYDFMYEFYPDTVPAWQQTLQNRELLKSEFFSKLHRSVAVISTLFIILYLLLQPYLAPSSPPMLRFFIILMLVSFLENAFLCSFFSHQEERYGGRMLWLLPLAACLVAIECAKARPRSTSSRPL